MVGFWVFPVARMLLSPIAHALDVLGNRGSDPGSWVGSARDADSGPLLALRIRAWYRTVDANGCERLPRTTPAMQTFTADKVEHQPWWTADGLASKPETAPDSSAERKTKWEEEKKIFSVNFSEEDGPGTRRGINTARDSNQILSAVHRV